MKYVIIDQINNGDLYTTETDYLQDAIQKAEKQFNALSMYDKKRRSDFFILESVNPDETAPNHLDGKEVYRWI